ncbi:hypothetical protein AB1Y20_020035 [Prymnesium parvum]|uniref:TLC domain-containing protein n=1 Tax=Prymnesium parvum TaxID=97485 RepID=A0AB34JSI8_PRYPA
MSGSLLDLWPAVPGAVIVALLRAACLWAFTPVGDSLAHRLHGEEWRAKLKPKATEFFAERCFYALTHILCTLAGVWTCWSHGWLGPLDRIYELPFTHPLVVDKLEAAGRYYVLETSFAIESSVNLARVAAQNGVGREGMMIVHHLAAIGLIAFSWSVLGLPEAGMALTEPKQVVLARAYLAYTGIEVGGDQARPWELEKVDHVHEEKRVLKQTCITDNDDGSKLRQCQRRRADLQLVEEFQSRMDILAASAAVVMRVPDTTERLQTNMPLYEAVSVLSNMNANLMQLPRDVEKQKELKWRAQMWAAKAVEKADAVQREALRAEVHASAAKRSADAALAAAEKEKEKATKKIKLAESKTRRGDQF